MAYIGRMTPSNERSSSDTTDLGGQKPSRCRPILLEVAMDTTEIYAVTSGLGTKTVGVQSIFARVQNAKGLWLLSCLDGEWFRNQGLTDYFQGREGSDSADLVTGAEADALCKRFGTTVQAATDAAV